MFISHKRVFFLNWERISNNISYNLRNHVMVNEGRIFQAVLIKKHREIDTIGLQGWNYQSYESLDNESQF